jgi:hypothetical protein
MLAVLRSVKSKRAQDPCAPVTHMPFNQPVSTG